MTLNSVVLWIILLLLLALTRSHLQVSIKQLFWYAFFTTVIADLYALGMSIVMELNLVQLPAIAPFYLTLFLLVAMVGVITFFMLWIIMRKKDLRFKLLILMLAAILSTPWPLVI